MRVLAFASQKAGAGKTTLAGHVAVQAQRSNAGAVAVIDVDPEAHLADWCAKRAEQPLRHAQAIQAELQQAVQALAAEGVELTIIDTPPALSHSIEAVLQVADLVAIPTRPYGHDLEAANATAELARQAGKPFVFIVNGAQVDAELAPDVVMTLAQYGPVATTQIPRSLAFIDAMIDGRTVMEASTEQAVGESLDALWKYLSKRFPKKGPAKQAIAGAAATSQGLFSKKASSRKPEPTPLAEESPKEAVSAPEVEVPAPAIIAESPVAPTPKAAAPMRPDPRKEQPEIATPRASGVVRKPRIGRLVLAASLSLIGLVGVGAVIAVNNLDAETYAGLITTAVEDATGRQLKIDGDIDVAIGLTPRIVIEKVSFSNPSWSKEPVMAAADRLEVEIRLIPLLFGDVKIKRIVLAGAQVNLEQSANGRTNWSFDNGVTPAAAAEEGEGGLPEIHQIRIENSKLVYVNHGTKERHEANIERLKLAADGLDQTLEFDLAATLDGQPFQASGEIDSVQALIDGSDLTIDVVAQSGKSSLALEGDIEAPYLASDMNIRIEGSGPALADIGRPFGVALSEHGPFKISGAVSGGGKQYRIDDLDASVARSNLKGTASLDMRGARPAFAGALRSEHLDLADITAPEPDTAPAEPDDGRIFSDDKLPFDVLKTVDGDLTFDAKSFVSNSVELSDVTGHLVLANGVATLSPFRAGISGGQLDLSSIIDASGKTPAVTLKTTADGVSGNDLLGLLGLDGILGGGRADLTLDVHGQGHSLHDLMGGLGGTGQLHMAGGYINNEFARFLLADMTQMIATAGQGSAGVSCLTTIFDAKKGIATSRNTVIDAPGAAIVGSGRINLNKETISMRFEPVAKQLGLSQFAIPVDVVGRLASPSVTTDAVDSAAKVAGTTAGLATDTVLGLFDDATGMNTGQVSRTVPSCGGGAAPVATTVDPATAAPAAQTAPVEQAAPVEQVAPVEQAAPAPQPAKSSQTATTSTTTKKKKAASSGESSTMDQAGEILGNVGSSVNGLFEGSTSSDAADTKTNK